MEMPVGIQLTGPSTGSAGVDAQCVFLKLSEIAGHRVWPVSRGTLLTDFEDLAETWREGVENLSSMSAIAMHPAYQRIIGLGPSVIPLLLEELQTRPDQWFHALNALTGVNPVPPSSRGNIRAMADAWVSWGRREGYIAGSGAAA
jgi:hypothetical protein